MARTLASHSSTSAHCGIDFVNSCYFFFFFSSRRRHTRSDRDWSSDVCSSDLRSLRRREELPGPWSHAALGRAPGLGKVNRIASLLPSATEIVYALGLGDRLVGDRKSVV